LLSNRSDIILKLIKMTSDEEEVQNVLFKASIEKQKRKLYNKKNYENIKNKKKHNFPNNTFNNLYIQPNENNGDLNDDLIDNNYEMASANDYIRTNNHIDENIENNDSNGSNCSSNESIYPSEESLNESSNNDEIENEVQFIYNQSNTTLRELAIAILVLKYKHKLSDLALDDTLKLIGLLLPSDNKIPKTSKKLISILNIETNAKENKMCKKTSFYTINNNLKKT
jgi:hypothetical protein